MGSKFLTCVGSQNQIDLESRLIVLIDGKRQIHPTSVFWDICSNKQI